jgi:hypothetical protein
MRLDWGPLMILGCLAAMAAAGLGIAAEAAGMDWLWGAALIVGLIGVGAAFAAREIRRDEEEEEDLL